MEEPLLSIIIPLYNAEKYLLECIQSIMKQTYENIEVILIDDGSTDRSGEICRKYAKIDKRLKYIRQDNKGVSYARNNGIIRANGEWLMFVDADDWIEPNTCQELMGLNLKEYDVVFFGIFDKKIVKEQSNQNFVELQKKDLIRLQRKVLNPYVYGSFIDEYIAFQGPYGKLMRRKFIISNDLSFPNELKIGEDIAFNLRLINRLQRGCVYCRRLYFYRLNSQSVLHKYNPDIFELLIKAAHYIKKQIITDQQLFLMDDYRIFVIRKYMYCVRLNYCNSFNDKPYNGRKKEFLLNRNNNLIRECYNNGNILDIKRKPELVVGFLIKHRFFGLINILNKLYPEK